MFSLFELFFSCSGKRKPTWNTGHCFACKFSNFQILLRHLRLTFDWLSVSSFDYWPIRISDLLLCTELTLFCTELTIFRTELPENCIYPNQSELSNFSMYIIKVQSMNICFINFTFHARIKLYFPDYQQDMLRMRCLNKFTLKLLIEKLCESFL